MNHDDSFIPGSVCWIDVSTTDPERSRDFYHRLFGWTYQIDPDPSSGFYTTALLDGLPVAGMGGTAAEQPGLWTLYLTTVNVMHTASVVQSWGGRVLYGPVQFPRQGSMLIAEDPTGAPVGFWQPAAQWTFHTADPGALVWAELNTAQGSVADRFFASMFGYRQFQLGDGLDVDYTIWSLGGHTILGRGQLTEGASPHWVLYFAVDPAVGADAAVAQVVALGGEVEVPPFDSGFGRVAVVRDPAGAAFSLIDASTRARRWPGVAANDDPWDD